MAFCLHTEVTTLAGGSGGVFCPHIRVTALAGGSVLWHSAHTREHNVGGWL